jgi:hypothetical protein
VISWLLNTFIGEQGSLSSINLKQNRADDSKKEQDDTIDLEHKGDNRWE